jgi:hypothetical protein
MSCRLITNSPVGMYTFPDGVLTRYDGSKSPSRSGGFPIIPVATRPFSRFIEGFRGGTSGGALSNSEPANGKQSSSSL